MMKIKVDSQLRISNATPEVELYIIKELSMPNPEIIKKQHMGFWTRKFTKSYKNVFKKW